MARNEPLSKGEKRLLIASIAFVIVAGAIWYAFYSINANPVVNVPEPPPPPNPNALDIYVAAQGLKVASIPVNGGQHMLTTDDVQNCIHAGKIGVPKEWGASAKPPKLADLQALMAKNAPVLAKAQQGFACEYREIPSRSINTLYPHLSKLRDLARIMAADGNVKCASGDWDGGAERYLDVIRMGNDCPRGGVMISMLLCVALQAIGRKEAWSTLDHVSGDEARRAARRLEEMAARRVPYADVLREEKWLCQASLLEIFNTPGWRKEMFPMMGHSSVNRALAIRSQVTSKRTIMRNYTEYMDALIINTGKPYPANMNTPPLPNDPISQTVLPIYDQAWIKYAVNQVENDLLMISFALRAYKADHGKYPAGLNELTPKYLKAIPDDPFSAKGIYGYNVTGKSYTLYSIGPDGKDDGGTPSAGSPNAGATGSSRQPITLKSTGDIVAGVSLN